MVWMKNMEPSLSLYEESTVVVWGAGFNGSSMVCWLQQLGIHVVACCDNQKKKWGNTFYGVPVISPEALSQWEKENILVQLALNDVDMPPVVEQLKTLNIPMYSTFLQGLSAIEVPLEEKLVGLYPSLEKEIHYSIQKQHTQVGREKKIMNQIEDARLFLLSPRKTGDITVVNTCRKANIPIRFSYHTPNRLKGIRHQPHEIKVITGVRDPISRDISDIFQMINSETISFLSRCTPEEGEAFIQEKKVQSFFDHYIENNYIKQEKTYSTLYSRFFENVATHVMDLKEKPLNPEQGYSIVREGNISLFFYQLERLNDIAVPLSQWLGASFDTLENGNIANDKWIAPYYAAAKENLQFSQEYVDAAYNDAYIQHFYSPKQIEAMKAKWQKNIK